MQEVRCQACGFLVMPQRARKCPFCNQFTLAMLPKCQHCQEELPPFSDEIDETPQNSSFIPRFKSLKGILPKLAIAAFIVLCAFGLKNYVQDRQTLKREESFVQQTEYFIQDYNAYQKQFRQSMQGTFLQNKTQTFLKTDIEDQAALLARLEQYFIPTCESLRQQFIELPDEAKQLIRSPENIIPTLNAQLELMQLLVQAIKTLPEDKAHSQKTTKTARGKAPAPKPDNNHK